MDTIELMESNLQWLRKSRAEWLTAFQQCPFDADRQLKLCVGQMDAFDQMIERTEQFLRMYKTEQRR